ncbi:ROK family transcriptional regulator [Virgibacillus flavescens]|uniref:ROK family transcriptional regulator n=1 Tax=Virgibacillus flavescens TaxID=1611422 RepID=UPI003D35382D
MQRGSFQWMKSLNKSIILNKIRTDGPISRAQIAKESNLTPPTVGSIVKELIAQGIVVESVLGASQGGRKPTMLLINNSDFYIIGIDAGPFDMRFILSDLSGKVLTQDTKEIKIPITKEEFLNMLKGGVRTLISENVHIKEKIIGVGVAMHGVVEIETGTSLYAPNLDLRDIPIKQELENTFDFEVKVENDARALAMAEKWFGGNENSKNMMVVNVGRGIGAGLVINGQLYHGEYDIAGEVGHMTLDVNGETCQCGNRGCLQTFASSTAIAKRAVQSIDKSPVLSEMVGGDLAMVSGKTVYEAAKQGDENCQHIIKEAGRYIGIGLCNLVHIVNPGKIIINGGVSKAQEFLLEPIKAELQARALTPKAKQTEVVVSTLGDHATSLGAVSLLLVELFNPGVMDK